MMTRAAQIPDRRLDFLVAGVMKGGTSALWNYLRQHPSIGMAESKELHFFDNDAFDWAKPDYDLLHSNFDGVADHKLLGEATPGSTYWPPCIERIRAYNSGIRLIVTLRDPVARAYSHWRMVTSNNRETMSFSEAIREGRSRISESPRIYSYVERGFYGIQFERIFSFFPREQVHIVRQVDLLRDPAKTLSCIAEFLEIPSWPEMPQPENYYSLDDGTIPKEDDVLYLRQLYRDDMGKLFELTGISIPDEF